MERAEGGGRRPSSQAATNHWCFCVEAKADADLDDWEAMASDEEKGERSLRSEVTASCCKGEQQLICFFLSFMNKQRGREDEQQVFFLVVL